MVCEWSNYWVNIIKANDDHYLVGVSTTMKNMRKLINTEEKNTCLKPPASSYVDFNQSKKEYASGLKWYPVWQVQALQDPTFLKARSWDIGEILDSTELVQCNPGQSVLHAGGQQGSLKRGWRAQSLGLRSMEETSSLSAIFKAFSCRDCPDTLLGCTAVPLRSELLPRQWEGRSPPRHSPHTREITANANQRRVSRYIWGRTLIAPWWMKTPCDWAFASSEAQKPG